MNRLVTALIALLTATQLFPAAPTTVILVRHAEKATQAPDSPLTAAGEERARELARVLDSAGVTAILTTQYPRTKLTAQPLAEALKIEPAVIEAGVATYAKSVAERIRASHAGGTVVVVGHSNTTVDVMRELGVANPPTIADSQHDDLFVVTLSDSGAKLTALRYGAVSR